LRANSSPTPEALLFGELFFGADFGAKWRLGHGLGQSNVRICPHLSRSQPRYIVENITDH
jgi:hypothetical protein